MSPANTLVLSLALLSGYAASAAPVAPTAPFSSATISGLPARNIGSAAMSGRIAALAGSLDPSGRTVLYVGAASGGVWKSEDGGTQFKPVFDEQPVQSIGAIALAPSQPQTVWVGTGEAWTRNSVSIGDGVYKSTDGGNTWRNVGLKESEHIAKIVVSARDPETVYVCVAGKLWSDSTERGLYRSRDGGSSWQLILPGSNPSTGCASVAADPADPNVLFAALWDFRRKGWTFRSGGETAQAASGSGLWRSTDGGDTWQELSPEKNPGFAPKPYGRIAVAVAPSNAQRVYAYIESAASALYVSDDGGKTWQARDKSQWMVWRSFYFANLVVDPKNADRVFKTDGALILSNDAGRSFSSVGGFNGMHGDVHDVWIDPANPQRVVAGDDGGIFYSYNGGSKWWKGDNLPISQFYHVATDQARPYLVYGGLQDNGSWVGRSSYPSGITSAQWETVYGGDGFWVFPDPADESYLYAESQGGFIARVRRASLDMRDLHPLLNDADLQKYKKLRFNWNTPIALSPNERGTLYVGSQFLLRSRDHGQSWERISPDLTTNDPDHQQQEASGGVTIDNSAAEMYETIYSISESPRDARVIWAGTDDGRLQLTRDGGHSWHDLAGTIPQLPSGSWVSWVQASPHEAGTAYAAFDRHSFGDMAPYVYVTHDFGHSWSALATAADPRGVRGYAHVIKEDAKRPGLLFLGTEFGLWVSVDGGQRWAQYKGGRIPNVAVRDLVVQEREDDLVLATHGRGIWIIDDISSWRALTPEVLAADLQVLASRPARQRLRANGGAVTGAAAYIGPDAPDGIDITYYQRSRHLYGALKLEVLDATGTVVADLPASKRPGINRVFWNMLEKAPRVPPAAQIAFSSTQGPRVLPGKYTVRLTDNGVVHTAPLVIELDPAARFTLADRRAQHAAAVRVRRLFGDESRLMDRILGLRRSLAAAADDAAPAPLRAALGALDGRLDTVRKRIVATTEGGAITGEERLREHTDQLYGALLTSEGRPTDYQRDNILALEAELRRIRAEFEEAVGAALPALNRQLTDAGKAPVAVPAADDDADTGGGSADPHGALADRDLPLSGATLPQDWRLIR